MKAIGESHKSRHLSLSEVRDDETVINIASIEKGLRASVCLHQSGLEVSHEQTGITGSHLGANGYTTRLLEESVVELKSIEVQNEFCEANQSVSRRRLRVTLVEVRPNGHEAIIVWNVCIESSDIHGGKKTGKQSGIIVEKGQLVQGVS